MYWQRMHILPSDRQLIEGINQKDKDLFELFYQKYWSFLLRFASRYIDDSHTCEEVVQEFFVHLYTTPLLLKIETSFRAYLIVALKHKIMNHQRKQATYQKHVAIACRKKQSPQISAAEQIETAELEKQIDNYIEQLPDKYKQVYILKKRHEFPLKKIASHLKRPVDTVDKQLRKALFLLRDRMVNQSGD